MDRLEKKTTTTKCYLARIALSTWNDVIATANGKKHVFEINTDVIKALNTQHMYVAMLTGGLDISQQKNIITKNNI